MKKTILILSLTGVIMAANIAALGQENTKTSKARKNVTEAQKDVEEAKKDLREAKLDSTEDYKAFKLEAEKHIMENKEKIAILKEKKWEGSVEDYDKYQRKIVDLEQKNNKLKKEIETSGNLKTDKWSSFKREFRHDMNSLGNAFKDLGLDNKK